MAFLAQFYATNERLRRPGLLCLQVYQCQQEADCSVNPVPIKVPLGAQPNSAQVGIAHPDIEQLAIDYEKLIDPDEIDLSFDEIWRSSSKIGGTCYSFRSLQFEPYDEYLLQLCEHPGDFNFGGLNAILLRDGERLSFRAL